LFTICLPATEVIEMKKCSKCNAIINPRWAQCLACGYALDGAPAGDIETALIKHDGGPSGPQDRVITRQVDSKVLGRTVDMVLDRDKPNDVIFDGVPYTMDEMSRLKGLDRESLIVAHDVKREFRGEVMP
jgi:hypothetical protein